MGKKIQIIALEHFQLHQERTPNLLSLVQNVAQIRPSKCHQKRRRLANRGVGANSTYQLRSNLLTLLSKPREDFKIVAMYNPSNIPGKTIIVGLIDVPEGGASPPHRHGGSAIVAVAFQGQTLNQMNDEEPIICGPGDFWYEAPGCHHQRSENVGEGRSKFIAVLVVDSETIDHGKNLGAVFVLDKEVEMGEKPGETGVGGEACH